MTCTYRGHGAVLAMGAPLDRHDGRDPRQAARPLRRQGRLDAPDRRLASARSARSRSSVPTCRSPAAPAFAAQTLGTGSVSLCFFGDGTTNIGAFHEALNLASVWKLPVIFVCENNLYGEYSPIAATTPVDASWPTGRRPTRCPACRSTATTSWRCGRPSARPARERARRRRPDADRGAHLPAHGPLAQRSGDLPAGGRARALAAARPDHAASRQRWRATTVVAQADLDARRAQAADRQWRRRCERALAWPEPDPATGSTTSGRRRDERA